MVKRIFWLALPWFFGGQANAAHELSEADFLTDFPTVLTASRLDQPIMDAPNAITVIDRKMIEASGFHHIADLFRLVPGFYVGHKSGWFQNVSNGLADEFSRRLQVLVDGRSVYLPSIGGVRWDALPLAMDDIERIEVVRGSNAATYGANAFTGVINIITTHAADSAGGHVHLASGSGGMRSATLRLGGGESYKHRLSLGGYREQGFDLLNDSQTVPMLTYRGDVDLGQREGLSLQFGYVGGRRGTGSSGDVVDLPHDQDVASHFQQADYRLGLGETAEFRVKAYHNYTLNEEKVPTNAFIFGGIPFAASAYRRDLLAERWHVEAQVNDSLSESLRGSWGGFIRRDMVRSEHYFGKPDDLLTDTLGLFGHLEWRLSPSWLVNAGAMLEKHDIAGATLSPRATLHWQPSPDHSLRVGLSRAYRNPVQFEENADWRYNLPVAAPPGGTLTIPWIISGGNLEPEQNTSQEIGYLGNWPELGVSLDMRLYRSRLSNLISITGNVRNPPRGFANTDKAVLQGFECQMQWRFGPHSRVIVNQSSTRNRSEDVMDNFSTATPEHQTGVHLMHRFPGAIDASLNYYRVSGFEPIGPGLLPGQERLDARVAKNFKMGGNLARVSLVLQNLGNEYYEFDKNTTGTNLFDRRGYVHFELDF